MPFTPDIFVDGVAGNTPITAAKLNNLENEASTLDAAMTTATSTVVNVKNYGAVGDGVADDSVAIVNAVTAAKTLYTTAGIRVGVSFPRGRYLTRAFQVPGGVSLFGESYQASQLVNTSTTGGVFVTLTGSSSTVRKLTINGQRAINTGGLAAVQFSRPNNPTAGALNIAGGVVLTAPTTAGGTSIAVNNASPGGEDIRGGDILTLVESTNYEMVRVARSYVPGSLTLPLEGSVATVFSVAAQVSVASNDVGISDCRVYSNGRDGVAFWHAIYFYADRNEIRDCSDSAVDMPSAGCRFGRIRGNNIETNGQWGVSFDTAETAFGRTSDNESSGNTIRFLAGGSTAPTEGIYFGNVDRCTSRDDTIDISRAGIAGVSYKGASTYCQTVNVNVIGSAAPRAGTSGIRQTTGASDLRMRIEGGRVWGVARGVELDQVRTAHVSGIDISNVNDYALNILGDSVNPQIIAVLNVHGVGNIVGLNLAGTPTAGNKVTTAGNYWAGPGFAPVVVGAGWNHVDTVIRDDGTNLFMETVGAASIYLRPGGSASANGQVALSGGGIGLFDAIGVTASKLWSGTGVPASALGANGDFFFRVDTPATSLQRLYVKSAGAWVGVL